MQVLLFGCGGRRFALPLREVREVLLRPAVVPLAEAPPWLEGFLRVENRAMPVIHLDRLLGVGDGGRSLYSHLLVVAGEQRDCALSVEQADEVLELEPDQLLPLDPSDSLAHVVGALIGRNGQAIPVLSGRRLLLEEEKKRLEHWATIEEERLGLV